MDCRASTGDAGAPVIPRRNLSEAFEELYVSTPLVMDQHHQAEGSNADPPKDQKGLSSILISPTNVADLHSIDTSTSSTSGNNKTNMYATKSAVVDVAPVAMADPIDSTIATSTEAATTLPSFQMHADLQKDLSQAVINRISFYGVIHDINKEATAMAANDDSGLDHDLPGEDMNEDCSPLVVSVKGPSLNPPDLDSDMFQMALIDEERWLLSAIELQGNNNNRSIQSCPPTFLQAMGECEYENPLTSLSSGSRTQLWKPSRSWWEAKSGKNPWIEPKSHNKRWRYLWPLIHYHKFLAKCIKKLKRNGVDVKQSVSPVAAFLREEVCAVSDHLASVSLFDSDKWMDCLQHFLGWTDASPEGECSLRELISRIELRPLAEHGDIDSPLLRSQIDEKYLRAMAAQRAQLDAASEEAERKNGSSHKVYNSKQARNRGLPLAPHHMHQVPNQVGVQAPGGVRRPRYGYNYPYPWWHHQGWHQAHYQQHPYGDDASVHSTLSTDYSEYGVYGGAAFPPMFHYYPSVHGGSEGYPASTHYHPEQAAYGFFGYPPADPNMVYGLHPQPEESIGRYYGMPQTPKASSRGSPLATQHESRERKETLPENIATEHNTPFKYDPNQTPSRSPYWGHLDSTITMGLSTPQTHTKGPHANFISPEQENEATGLNTGQPLYHYGYSHPVQNYGPPSPATQFMMSPQANFAYGHGYSPNQGHAPSQFKQTSPQNGGSYRKGANTTSLKRVPPGLLSSTGSGTNNNNGGLTSKKEDRHSPSTVETIAESETLSEAA